MLRRTPSGLFQPVRGLLRPLIRPLTRTPLQLGDQSIISRAIGILRSFGANASSFPFATLQGAYQTSAGPAAAAVNDPIGLELDVMGTVGPELLPSGLTGATVNTGASIVGGSLVMVATAPGYAAFIDGTSGFVAGNWYKVAISSIGVTGNCQVLFQGSAISGVVFGTAVTEMYFVAPSITNSRIQVNNNTGGSVDGTVSVSIKQVTGNHATQTTAINRPTVQRGLWNLLTYSNDLSNAAWSPIGTANVVGSVVNMPADLDRVVGTVATTVGQAYTLAVMLSGSGTIDIGLYDAVAGPTTTTVTLTSTPTIYVISRAAQAASTNPILVYRNGTTATTVTFGGAGLFQGTLTADQILQQGGIPLTTSAAGSNPTAGPYWASFNGTNSSLALSSVPFQMADDHCVIGCVTFYDTTGNYVWASQGTALIGLRAIAGKAGAVWYDDGVAHLIDLRGTTTLILGQPYVLCMWTVGGVHYLRLNSVTEGSVAKPAYGASTLTTSTIGSNGGTECLNGALYEPDIIKGTLTLAQVVTLEKAAGLRAGLVI